MTEPWPEAEVRAASRSLDDGPRGGPEYAQLHAAHRLLQDRLAAAALPPEVSREVTAQLLALAEVAGAHATTEWERRDGWRTDLPGRGMALMPPYVIDGESDAALHGRVTFTRFHLGGNGTAHGGTQPLLFDDVLGRIVNHNQRGVARTAFLHVDYRRVTPLNVELHFEATRDRVEGRKRWGSARLRDAEGNLLVEAQALFVELNPGQP